MVNQHHAKRVAEKPNAVQLAEVGLLDVVKLQSARNERDDGWSAEGHQSGGSRVKSGRSRKQVDGETQDETQHQQLPLRYAERQQHNENQIDIRMHIASQADVVDDQHLEKHERDEANDLEN